jgi:hypothetical protein
VNGTAAQLPNSAGESFPNDPATESALPVIPSPPAETILTDPPDCHREYLTLRRPTDRALSIHGCVERLDGYKMARLDIYFRRINRFRERLNSLLDRVNSGNYSFAQKDAFYQRIIAEIDNASQNGEYLDRFRTLEHLYLNRRNTLAQAFCVEVACR